MPLTNRAGVCKAWLIAAEKEDHDLIGWMRCTELISPIRQVLLKKRHAGEIVEDVMDRMWAIFGQAIHSVLEQSAGKDALAEQRFAVEIGGRLIQMTPDRVEKILPESFVPTPQPWPFPIDSPQFELIDFKNCKVWAVLLGEKWEWTAQTNIYAHGLRKIGINVTKIHIECLMRDWDKMESIKDRRYPQEKVKVLETPIWTPQQCEDFMLSRIRAFEEAWEKPDTDLPFCSPKERWERPDRWAVMKVGADRALRVFDTEREAQNELAVRTTKMAAGKPKDRVPLQIELRKGCSIRCEGSGDYAGCPVRNWCSQYHEEISPPF
jgi:hypothetical protein